MEEYYFELMLIGGTGLVFCFTLENKILRFFAFTACFFFGGLGFLASVNVADILGYSLISVLFAYMLSSAKVKDYLVNAVLHDLSKDTENK